MTHTPVTLSDPNTAQVHKVATYCLSKLQEQNIHMDLSPKYIRRPVYLSEEEAEPVPSGRPVLELLCNGMVCVMELIVVMHHTCASYHGLNLIYLLHKMYIVKFASLWVKRASIKGTNRESLEEIHACSHCLVILFHAFIMLS